MKDKKKSLVSVKDNDGLEKINEKLNTFLKELPEEERKTFLVILSKAASSTAENSEIAKDVYNDISNKEKIELEDLANSLQGQEVWAFTFWSFSF